MKYFIALVVLLLVLAVLRWCFLPHGRLPRHRVRYLRLRLRLRLHPGRGHATVLRVVAAVGAAGRVPPQRPGPAVGAGAGSGCCRPRLHSMLLGRAHYRHALRLPLDEHVVVMAPAAGGQDRAGWPRSSCTTRAR